MATNQEQYRNTVEEMATSIAPYRMRRMFKMRDPYPVIVARNWARDMAFVECLLCFGCAVSIAAVTYGTISKDNLIEDDDHLTIGGVEVTGRLKLSESFLWADYALAPFLYKGLLVGLEVAAVACACQGACLVTCCHLKCWHLDELGILQTLGRCNSCSVAATTLSVALTTLILLVKWQRALEKEINGSLLVMSVYAILLLVLLCLRASTMVKAFRATAALQEEVSVV